MPLPQETLDLQRQFAGIVVFRRELLSLGAGLRQGGRAGRGVRRTTDLQAPGGVRHEQRPGDRRPHLPAVPHGRAAAGHAADQPDRGPRRVGPVQRLLLQPDHAGPDAGDGLSGGLRLRRPGARAADGLRDLGRGPVDHRRGPRPGQAGRRPSATFRSIPISSTAWGRRSTRAPACSSTGRRATANRPSPSGSRCCFGQEIWIPHAIYEDGQIIKFYDSAYHKQVASDERSILKSRRARPALAEDLRVPRWSSAAS